MVADREDLPIADEGEAPADQVDQAEPPAPASIALGLVILAGLVVAAIVGLVSLAPDEVRQKDDPGFIDNIFANVVVIAASRIVLLAGAVVLLFGGVYIAVSVVVRMTKGQWLRRAGPFESELAEEAERLEEAEDYLEEWLEALQQKDELAERLEERDVMINQLLEDRETLIQALENKGEA